MGNAPRVIATADLNGDGTLDLAVASTSNSSGGVTILLGNGSGGFTQASGSPFTTGTAPRSIAVGDLDGDGKLDLAVANTASNTLTILLGNGSGGFSQPAGSPIAVGSSPDSVAAGDMNGDGTLDLAVANFAPNTVRILLGNGSGGFSQAAGSPVAVGSNPISIASGDLNRDGTLDLAVVNESSDNITILLGNGSGGFSQAAGSPVATGQGPMAGVIGDWNADGKVDLAVAAAHSVAVLLGNGVGGFSSASGSPISLGIELHSIATGDLNKDGHLDFALVDYPSMHAVILLGNGSGAFAQAATSPIQVGDQPTFIAVGDLDKDGRIDLAVANFGSSNATILLNTTTFAPDGTACNDGNLCSANDTCGNGSCTGASLTIPNEVTNLTFMDTQTLVWDSAVGAGPGTVHDVPRGRIPGGLPVGTGAEACIASGVSSATASDASTPLCGAAFWYLVRGRNSCGAGSYGSTSTGAPRVTNSCP